MHRTMHRTGLVLPILLAGAVALAAAPATQPLRQSAPPAAPAPATPDAIAQPITSLFDAAARGEAAVAKANALLAEIAKAYRDAPTLTDEMTLTIGVMDNVTTETFAVALGKGSDARLAIPGATFLAADGQLTLVADEPADKALRLPLKGDLMATLRESLPNFSLPVTILDLRAGRPLTSEALGMLALRNPRIAGLREADGRVQLLVLGENGASGVSVDPATHHLVETHVLFTPPDAPPGMAMELTLAHKTAVAESLGSPLSVFLGERKIVTSVEDFMPSIRMIEPGAAVPTWTMRSLDGTTVSLADLRGSVVVLDFWASYCAPCKRAMPYVDEFAKWAAQSGKPIKVFAVNTLESGDAAARVESATAWWRQERFSMPCLMDIDDGVARSMGIAVMPTTLIIGPDGVLRAVHQSFDPVRPGRTVEELKAAVEKALAAKG